MTSPRVKPYFLHLCVFLVPIFHSIPASLCIDARISYHVDGNGFHRNIAYEVNVEDFDQSHCHVAIHVEFPTGLYVNVDELADLRRLGASTVCSIGEEDVELFMEKAKPQNVTACALLIEGQAVLNLLIHQRYQYAKEHGGYVGITLPKPKLLLGCKERIKEHRVSKMDLCSPCVETVAKWREIPYTMDQGDYIWLVPVGDSSWLTVITHATLLVTILGAMFITRTIWNSAPEAPEKQD